VGVTKKNTKLANQRVKEGDERLENNHKRTIKEYNMRRKSYEPKKSGQNPKKTRGLVKIKSFACSKKDQKAKKKRDLGGRKTANRKAKSGGTSLRGKEN